MTTLAAQPSAAASASTDPLHLIDVDHVQFYVGNAKQAAFFYAHCFGFQVEQVCDLTTGSRDAAHYLLTQGNIRFLLTSGLTPSHASNMEVAMFGDGVKDVAFTVFNAERAYERAIKNGAESAAPPRTYTDANGSVTTASIKTFGRVVHTFVSRTGAYELTKVKQGGVFMPRFRWRLRTPGRHFLRPLHQRTQPEEPLRPQVRRSPRRQRRNGQDELLGQVLRASP